MDTVASMDSKVVRIETGRDVERLSVLRRLRVAAHELAQGSGAARAAAVSGLGSEVINDLVNEIRHDPHYLDETIAEHVMRAAVGEIPYSALGTELLRNLYNDREFPWMVDALCRGA